MAYNLSRSFAKPCDILCDLTVDDVAIPRADVIVGGGDMVYAFFNNETPTLKFNGEGYSVKFLLFTAPSYHTIEDIRAEVEVRAVATNPSGGIVVLILLARPNPYPSRTRTLINSLVPYANTEQKVPVNLGTAWSLTQMVPPEPAYFYYREGPGVNIVVFRSMGNIDPNDYAMLVKLGGNKAPPPLQSRNFEVFFNDIQHIAGVPDGKAYMRCRRVKKKGEETTRITPVKGLEDQATKRAAEEEPTTFKWVQEQFRQTLNQYGAFNVGVSLLFILAVLGGLYAAYTLAFGEKGLTLARSAQKAASSTRTLIGNVASRTSTLATVAASKATNLATVATSKASTLAKEAAKQPGPAPAPPSITA